MTSSVKRWMLGAIVGVKINITTGGIDNE